MIFDKEWFRKHQKGLLWLLNTPIVKAWFRWVMCIDQNQRVDRIDPNGLFWKKENGKVGFDLRTHNKYSKRLYYGFYPLWALFHVFDMEIANKWIPVANLGFDSFEH